MRSTEACASPPPAAHPLDGLLAQLVALGMREERVPDEGTGGPAHRLNPARMPHIAVDGAGRADAGPSGQHCCAGGQHVVAHVAGAHQGSVPAVAAWSWRPPASLCACSPSHPMKRCSSAALPRCCALPSSRTSSRTGSSLSCHPIRGPRRATARQGSVSLLAEFALHGAQREKERENATQSAALRAHLLLGGDTRASASRHRRQWGERRALLRQLGRRDSSTTRWHQHHHAGDAIAAHG